MLSGPGQHPPHGSAPPGVLGAAPPHCASAIAGEGDLAGGAEDAGAVDRVALLVGEGVDRAVGVCSGVLVGRGSEAVTAGIAVPPATADGLWAVPPLPVLCPKLEQAVVPKTAEPTRVWVSIRAARVIPAPYWIGFRGVGAPFTVSSLTSRGLHAVRAPVARAGAAD